MPFITPAIFNPKWYMFNGHIETIYPSMYRKVPMPAFQRERLALEDGDFLDLDWLKASNEDLVILSHGLEGSSRRPYCVGMANAFFAEGWDILAWNCRSCSGEMNRTVKLYSHADTDDIATVIHHAHSQKQYKRIVLIGFSMGGAISLNYLGRKSNIPETVVAAIGFSMPTDLAGSVRQLEQKGNAVYKNKFLKQLSAKIQLKAAQFPTQLDASRLADIRQWRDFDTFYSAPMNGFESPEAFYAAASALHVLPNIKVPFLICNAQNDPLLTPECSPVHLAEALPNFWLSTPQYGGHVGFYPYKPQLSWIEEQAILWIKEVIG